MIGAPAAARSFTDKPLNAMALSVVIALVVVWAAIALSYQTNYPVGFFVGTLSAACYTVGRVWAAWRRSANIGRGINTAASSGEPATGRITLNA
jgi:zinc/manganese transport system permease protein